MFEPIMHAIYKQESEQCPLKMSLGKNDNVKLVINIFNNKSPDIVSILQNKC